jgi:hypothetical protein
MSSKVNTRPDYVRASKLRKKLTEGDELEEDDAAWFESYEASKQRQGRPPINASASEKITYTEERAAATGDHPHPVAYEGMVRAEGLRADTLLRIAADALVRCNEQYAVMNAHLLDRTTAIEDAHVAMLESVREHYIARAEAEAENIRMQHTIEMAGAGGEEGSELQQILAYLMQAKVQADATPEGQRAKMKRVREAKKRTRTKVRTGKPLGDMRE